MFSLPTTSSRLIETVPSRRSVGSLELKPAIRMLPVGASANGWRPAPKPLAMGSEPSLSSQSKISSALSM